jgi:hypothetical protein
VKPSGRDETWFRMTQAQVGRKAISAKKYGEGVAACTRIAAITRRITKHLNSAFKSFYEHGQNFCGAHWPRPEVTKAAAVAKEKIPHIVGAMIGIDDRDFGSLPMRHVPSKLLGEFRRSYSVSLILRVWVVLKRRFAKVY